MKSANEVVVEDVICEPDGFMWRVVGVTPNGSRVTFNLVPVYQSITARGPVVVSVKRNANVRIVTAA